MPVFKIARWEVADHLNSPRVILLALLLLILFPAVATLRLGPHAAAARDYEQRVRAQEENLRWFAHVNRIGMVAQPVVPPARMEILVEPTPVNLETRREALETDAIPRLLEGVDFGFVVSFLLPLWTILTAQASASDQRVSGRLQLLLAQPVSRWDLLLGKWLGITLLSVSILALGLLLSAGVIFADQETAWTQLEWSALALIFGVAAVYIAFVAAAGLWIGSAVRDAGMATMAALCLWTGLEVLIPMTAPLAAGALHTMPESAVLERQIADLIAVEREEALRQALAPYKERGLSESEAWRAAGAEEINRRFFARAAQLRADFQRRERVHLRITAIAAAVSPAASLRAAIREISGVGMSRLHHVAETVSAWSAQAQRYLDDKYADALARDPSFKFNDWLDVRDGPRFRCAEQPLAPRLAAAAPYGLYVIVAAALALAVAGWVFSRTTPQGMS